MKGKIKEELSNKIFVFPLFTGYICFKMPIPVAVRQKA
jgi:hypothetical protein